MNPLQPASFDNYALTYDDHFTNSVIGKAQRDIVQSYVEGSLYELKNVLEVNCGTGEDAVFIAGKVNSVVCTDASQKMIDVAKTKTAVLKNCSIFKTSIQELQEKVQGKFDIIFSNFGGLNCLSHEEIRKFSETCKYFLDDRGELVFVVMGRKCMWERLYFRMKGLKNESMRRKESKGVSTNINETEFLTYYYSPSEMETIFRRDFKTLFIKPVGIFIPPSYLEPFFARHRFLFSVCKLFDKMFRNMSFLSDYSDHYIIHFQKK